MADEEFDMDQVRKMLEGADFGSLVDHEKNAATLADLVGLYSAPAELVPGMVVRQRPGLGVQRRDLQVIPYVFFRYATADERVTIKIPLFHELDCIIGQLDSDGDLAFVMADSHRFEEYPPEALAALSLEARKRVN